MTLLTYAAAAEELAVSPRTVRRLVADGELAVTTVRGARRIHAADLEEFVAARRDVAVTSRRPARAALRHRPRRVSAFREQIRGLTS